MNKSSLGLICLLRDFSMSISTTFVSSFLSEARQRTSPSGSTTWLCPIKLSELLGVRFSVPTLLAVTIKIRFSKQRVIIACGQCGRTRLEGCAIKSAPLKARVRAGFWKAPVKADHNTNASRTNIKNF